MSNREVLREFATHVTLGTALFLLIYAPAVALNFFVLWLHHCGVSAYLALAVEGAEWALIIADTMLYFVFLSKTTYRAAIKLCAHTHPWNEGFFLVDCLEIKFLAVSAAVSSCDFSCSANSRAFVNRRTHYSTLAPGLLARYEQKRRLAVGSNQHPQSWDTVGPIRFKCKGETMAKFKIQPLDDRIIVEPLEPDATTAGGIVLPDFAKERPQRGKVIAVGPGRLLDSGERGQISISVGDEVLYGKYGGMEITIEGNELKMLRETDVLALLSFGDATESLPGAATTPFPDDVELLSGDPACPYPLDAAMLPGDPTTPFPDDFDMLPGDPGTPFPNGDDDDDDDKRNS